MGAGDFLSGIGEKCRSLLSKASELIKSHITAAIGIAAGLGIIIVLLIALAIVRRLPPRAVKSSVTLEESFAPRALSPADLFMPPEPDFVPEVLLEREPRDGWSEEDARPFWTDPMEENPEKWRRLIQSGVDEILERVP